MKEKSVSSQADGIALDLEDALTIEKKVQARGDVIRDLNELEFGNRLRVYARINRRNP
jgi:citrate lyase beta subunit